MDVSKFTDKFIEIVREAERSDNKKLRLLRSSLLKTVDLIGPKNFVTLSANILKNNFRIEGCEDARLPLKRIFNVSLEDLDGFLKKKRYPVGRGHPLHMLSMDHVNSVGRLKTIDDTLSAIEGASSDECLIEALNELNDLYSELDIHIRKEEEVFFPLLEKCGMEEHPEALREEHKKFRGILSELTGLGAAAVLGDRRNVMEKILYLKQNFIPVIANHIFRETYVFYPAALEFIKEADQWEKIRQGFEAVR